MPQKSLGTTLYDEEDLSDIEQFEQERIKVYQEKLKLGLNSLTKGGDFKAIRDCNIKENLINVGAMKVRRDRAQLIN